MIPRISLALTILSGLPAAAPAQELIRVSYTWQEVVGLTTTPVTHPNSILEPGEGARISLHLEALINGTNAIGQTTTYTPPPPPGAGTVKGIASFIYNLRGDGGAPSAAGTWGTRSISPLFAFAPIVGNSQLGGALLASIGSGQFVAPGGTANSTNPIDNAFRGVWVPASYAPRTVTFQAEPGIAAPTGQHNGILIAYGIVQPMPDPATWYEIYIPKFIGSDFGAGVSIAIVPAPSACLVWIGLVFAAPERRRHAEVPR